MKRKLLFNQHLERWLAVVLALLLMPVGLWAEEYNLWVNGQQVTSDNASNVLGDQSEVHAVVYDAANNKLTLNNATIEPSEEAPAIDYTGDANFTISLIGTSQIQGIGGCPDIRYNGVSETAPTLTFAKGDDNNCVLELLNANQEYIEGFNTDYTGFFSISEDNALVITASILGGGSGTSTDPLLLKSADDLALFATYINNKSIGSDVYVQLYNDIDCTDLTAFTPIGSNIQNAFTGTFDGNNKTISNLSATEIDGDCVGIFRYLGENGQIQNLTIDNLTLSGGNSSCNYIGGLVGYLSGGTVNSCTVQNSTMSCKSACQNPTVGGIVGELGSGTISNCTLLNSAVKAQTTDTWASGANANAGGIAGSAIKGIISGCQVKGTTTLLADYGKYSATLTAAAIIAKTGYDADFTLQNNTYEYTVTTSTNDYYLSDDTNTLTTKSGYEQRGTGYGEVISDVTYYDIFDNNGAVMYTQTVTLPAVPGLSSVYGEEGTYYNSGVAGDLPTIAVAPGQTVTVNAIPGEGYAIASLTATNATTSATIETSSTAVESTMQYTFTMPDAPVTVEVSTATAYGITVADVIVTELNYSDVLGDGKVSFDNKTKTLTLNGATISGGIIYSLEDALTVHLLGENVIDGGWTQDANGEFAFTSKVEGYVKLSFTTDDTNPGQLLMKNTYRDTYVQYFSQFNVEFSNGLVQGSNSSDTKSLIAVGPVITPSGGLFWPDQEYTITGSGNGEITYVDYLGGSETKTYSAPFTMATTGQHYLSITETVTYDESSFEMNIQTHYKVYTKPGFSVEAGMYVGEQTVTLTNLPDDFATSTTSYPQVWYYLGENAEDSIQITAADQEIPVTESTKVCVYYIDEDSSKVVKSDTVQAEYTILADIANVAVVGLQDSVYTGKSIVPEFTVKASVEAESNLTADTDYTVSYKLGEVAVTEMTDVAAYTIVITGKGSYGGTTEVAFNITKGQATVTTAPVADTELVYTGEAQTLIKTAGAANFGAVLYSLTETGDYAETLPFGTTAGDYTVFYTVPESDNYDGTDTLSVSVTIAKADITPTVTLEGWAYGSDANTPVVTGNVGNGNVTYTYAAQNAEAFTADVPTEVGHYVVRATIAETPNYNGGEATCEFAIDYRSLVVGKDVTFADGQKWASYYNVEESINLPEGYMAYIVTEVGESSVTVQPINYIPQEVPVLIEKDSEVTTENTSADGNLLAGAVEDVDVSSADGTVYGLYNNKLMRVNRGTIPAGRAYLMTTAPQARELTIWFDDVPLGISETVVEKTGADSWYTIDGRKLQKKPVKKGLYINNGHTVVIK